MTWYACDIETEGLDFTRDKILSFAFYSPKDTGVLTTLPAIIEWLTEHKRDKFIWHSGKFDVKFLRKALGFEVLIDWDTLLAESILPDRPDSLSLESVAGKELGVPRWKSKEMYQDMGKAKTEDIIALNLQDVEYIYQIFEVQLKKLKELGLLKYFLENNLGIASASFLAEMEYRGIGLNYEKMQEAWKVNLAEHEELCRNLYDRFGSLIAEYEEARLTECTSSPPGDNAPEKSKALYEKRLQAKRLKCRFNFNSPKQVLWLLQTKLGFPCKDMEGKNSTSKQVLEFYRGQHEIIDELLKLRNNEHDSGSFFKNWDKYHREGRLHPSYYLDATKTFRLSCREPALQQVPRGSQFRELFVPAEGYKLAVIDYSQIEPRLIAHYSGDRVLTQIFTEGFDLYEYVAREILKYNGTQEEFKTKDKNIRAVAKEIALSSFYGIGPDKFAYRLRLNTGINHTAGEAKRYLTAYFDMLSGVKEYRRWLVDHLQHDPSIETIFGRKLFFKPEEFVHLAFNKLIQCSGSDINLYSQIDLDKYFKSANIDTQCIHLVHDEALFEYQEKDESVVLGALEYYMASRYKGLINVPIKLEIKTGYNWGCKN